MKKRRKVSLKMQLMLSYGLMAFFLVISLLVISNVMLEHHFKVYVQQRQEQANQALVAMILDEFKEEGTPSLEFLERLGTDALKQGIVLMVKDNKNEEMYCESCMNRIGCEEMHTKMKQMMQSRYPNWEGKYTEKVYELKWKNTIYGSVVLGYYGPFFFHEEDLQFMNLVNVIFILVAFIVLILAIAMGIFLAERIAQPLHYVMDRTKALEQQQYEGRIEFVSNTKELDELIGSVNTLADALEKQQQIKHRMARDYAHEFRTPLTALQSNLEAMIDGIFEPTKERLESCLFEILRLSRMAGQINRLVEIENNHVFIQKEWFDLKELLVQTVSNFEQEWREKNLQVKVKASRCEILADRDKMSQVVINLLSNAIKYTKAGGTISIKAKEVGYSIHVIVEDTGEGIAKEEIPNIFEYLYRTDDSRTRETGGSGIGLAVVKSIVTAHGGKIEVESELGKGSRFLVVLPKK